MSKSKNPSHVLYEVTAVKVKDGEFGFLLCYDEFGRLPGYYVSADREPTSVIEGQVKLGDRVLSINGHSITHLPPYRVFQLIVSSPRKCKLRLQRGPFNVGRETRLKGAFVDNLDTTEKSWIAGAAAREKAQTWVEVVVRLRKTEGKLGFSVLTFEHPEELGLEPKQNIYVSKVASDNAARYICVGDQILEVNGFPLDGRSYREVIEILSRSPDLCTLKLRRSPQVSESMEPQDMAPPSYNDTWEITPTPSTDSS